MSDEKKKNPNNVLTKKKWEEKKIGKMGFWQRGGDFLVATTA